jgi:hypothetical protein
LVGPVDGKEYTYRDEFDLVSTNQAPCGVSTVLNINSDVRVNNANNTKGSGYLATDSIDTALATVCFDGDHVLGQLLIPLYLALIIRRSTSCGRLAPNHPLPPLSCLNERGTMFHLFPVTEAACAYSRIGTESKRTRNKT